METLGIFRGLMSAGSCISIARSFIRSLFHSLVRLFIRSFACTFIRSFARSFARSFLRLYAYSFIRSFVCSFIRSPVRLSIYPFVSPLILSLVQLSSWRIADFITGLIASPSLPTSTRSFIIFLLRKYFTPQIAGVCV